MYLHNNKILTNIGKIYVPVLTLLTTDKFSLNLLLKTTTKTKTMIINLPTDNFHCLLYMY